MFEDPLDAFVRSKQKGTDSGNYQRNARSVITEGRFYSTRSLHQHAEAWIDDDDRLQIDTEGTRVIVDPR